MPVDAAVAVHVVQLEVPAQLVLHLAAHHQAERRHVLHEVYVAVLQATTTGVLLKTSGNGLCASVLVLFSSVCLGDGSAA